MSRKEQLNTLFKKYNLYVEDIFKHKHYNIITISGIDKIQAKAGINIDYDLKHYNPDLKTCIIKATGTKESITIQTYGECSPENNRNAYPVAIAEKRAMSRIVLKLCGFYELATEAQEFGKLLHKMVLEPEEMLQEYIQYEGRRAGKAWTDFQELHLSKTIVTSKLYNHCYKTYNKALNNKIFNSASLCSRMK